MPEFFDWPAFLPEFSAAARACGFRHSTLMETADGPLIAWEKDGDVPITYLSSGIHGDEPAGPLALLEMMRAGCFHGTNRWMICPALNPGGLALGTRENRAGLDPNRDYLLKSSPEVAAHTAWLATRPVPDLFVSLHEDWESQGFYLYEINTGADDPRRAACVLAAVSPHFQPEPGPEIDGHEVRGPGWIHHRAEADLPESWPEAIYLAKSGCPLSFTFETPSCAPLGKRVAAHIAGLSGLLGRPA
ncbi:M14 family metallocarboxypeptidase [Akkermansiaceae bacterium]|nr:M14 family metallocarboxypeptidase [Akkermansiaceae bacterium]